MYILFQKVLFVVDDVIKCFLMLICSYRGKAGRNANFEALPEDWRERMLKKRKMMKSK